MVSCAASTVATHMMLRRNASVLHVYHLSIYTYQPRISTTCGNHHHSSNHRYLKLFYSSIDSSSASGFFFCLGLSDYQTCVLICQLAPLITIRRTRREDVEKQESPCEMRKHSEEGEKPLNRSYYIRKRKIRRLPQPFQCPENVWYNMYPQSDGMSKLLSSTVK